jgi:hypothetical protein
MNNEFATGRSPLQSAWEIALIAYGTKLEQQGKKQRSTRKLNQLAGSKGGFATTIKFIRDSHLRAESIINATQPNQPRLVRIIESVAATPIAMISNVAEWIAVVSGNEPIIRKIQQDNILFSHGDGYGIMEHTVHTPQPQSY